jgi:hypothetical protein
VIQFPTGNDGSDEDRTVPIYGTRIFPKGCPSAPPLFMPIVIGMNSNALTRTEIADGRMSSLSVIEPLSVVESVKLRPLCELPSVLMALISSRSQSDNANANVAGENIWSVCIASPSR